MTRPPTRPPTGRPSPGDAPDRTRPAGLGSTLLSAGPLVWGLLTSRDVPLWKKVAGLGVPILYVLFPVDLVPDVVPLAGRIDDGGVWLATLLAVARSVPTSVVENALVGRRGFGPRRARAVALALRDPRRAVLFLVVGTVLLAIILTVLTVLLVVGVWQWAT